MVVFITLEQKVEEYVPRNEAQDYVVQSLIQNIEHKEDCKNPEIKLTYDTVTNTPIEATYDNSRKILTAGCMCGATASKDISQGYVAAKEESQQRYSVSSGSSYSKSDPIAKSYY